MPGNRRSCILLLSLVVLAVAPACRSTTWNGLFWPTPAETLVGPHASEGGEVPAAPVARVLLSVRGAERRGGERSAPFEMCVRMRVENRTDAPLQVVLADFLLLDADLDAFGPARVDGPGGSTDALSVPAGLPVLVDLRFEFPDGREPEDLDLDGLNLRGAVRDEQQVYTLGVTFTRGLRVIYRTNWYRADPYFGPWPGPWPGSYYGGYGYSW